MKIAVIFAWLGLIGVGTRKKLDCGQSEFYYQAHIDSLKWKMYALNYDIHLLKMVDTGLRYMVIRDSIFKPVECDVKLTKEIVRGDTTHYFFEFQRINEKDKYRQPENSYVGVGYIKKSKIYFPIHGTSGFEVEESFFRKFFKQQEQEFLIYLRAYKGNTAQWLKEEAKRRRIFE